MAIDDRTPNLNLALPNKDNTLLEDVERVRDAFTALDTAVAAKAETSALGAKADLVGGKVPAIQLPSFVDDVVEVANFASLPTTGESGKIYVTLDTDKTYRWGGSAYAEISASPGSTDAVPEGAANKYFTDVRARAAQVPATVSSFGVIKIGTGLNIDGDGKVNVIGGGGGGSTQTFTEVILTPASNGQTSFTITGGYIAGQVELFLNGVLLYGGGDDYTATNGSTVVLTVGANTTDTLLLRRWAEFDTTIDAPSDGKTYGRKDAAWSEVAIGAATLPQRTITSADTLISSDQGKLINAGGTFTLSLTAAATLGSGFWCYVQNTSNGDVTLDPNGSELVGGQTTAVVSAGFVLLLTCNGASFNLITVKERTYNRSTLVTATGTFTVPQGMYVLRAYAVGRGGVGVAADPPDWRGGAGGGMAYGDMPVQPGQTVSINITSGVAKVSVAGVDLLTANSASGTTTRGTASKHASVQNGGAYSGGLSDGVGGASSGSPLGVGVGSAAGTHGGAGWGGSGEGYGGGGLGRSNGTYMGSDGLPLGSGVAEPLLKQLTGLGGYSVGGSAGGNGGPGGGGGGGSSFGPGGVVGPGGLGGFGGGGGGGNSISGGAGGFGGGGGSSTNGPTTGAGGFGGGSGGSNTGPIGNAGAAAVYFLY